MHTVSYEREFQYSYDDSGSSFPRLTLTIKNRAVPDRSFDLDAYLDSGAERSLFSGWIGFELGIEILEGRRLICQTTHGSTLEVRLHPVQLCHPVLGNFELEVAFSTSPISRNLLGRDFFNHGQIGFRERHRVFFLSSQP